MAAKDRDTLINQLREHIDNQAASFMPEPVYLTIIEGVDQADTGFVWAKHNDSIVQVQVPAHWDLTSSTGGTEMLILAFPPNTPVGNYIAIMPVWDGGTSTRYVPLKSTSFTDNDGNAITDHGNLTGLGDDDHTQYTRKDTLTAKGSIYGASAASTPAELAVGTNDTLLAAASGQSTGLQWEAPINSSAGAGDAGKLVRLDAAGHIDATMINDGDIDHGSVGGLADDDHTQYLLIDGTRAMTGELDLGQDSTLAEELGADPSTPAANHWRIFFKSGGLFVIDDAGVVTGPLGVVSGGITKTTSTFAVRVELHDETLGASGTFDVSSISQDYDHLELVLTGRSDEAVTADIVNMYFNNDTTDANYLHGEHAAGSGHGIASSATARMGVVPGASATANYFGVTTIFIPDYTSTTFEHISRALGAEREDATTIAGRTMAHHWEDTSAINRITIQPNGAPTDEFITGSRLQIYGIKTQVLVTDVSGGGATQLTDLSDVNTAAVDAGKILRADGVDFESVLLSDFAVLNTGDIVTGTLQIQVPTATDEALILQTTDDDGTNFLFLTKNSAGSNMTQIEADGLVRMERYTSETNLRRVINSFFHRTSATPAAGFGAQFVMGADSDGGEKRNQLLIQTNWLVPTDATRRARLQIFTYDTAAREFMRSEGDGSFSVNTIGGATTDPLTTLKVQAQGATYIPLVVKGAVSQSANLLEARDSSAEKGVAISPDAKELRFYDPGASNYVGFEAPALSADQIWVLPAADGDGNDVLSTDGAGALDWKSGKDLGHLLATTATFVSGTGTAGTVNTAETVVTRTVPANSLTQVGDRIRIRTWFFANAGAAIVGTTALGPSGSEVNVGDVSHTGGASFNLVESWVHYVDNTHANIIEQESGGTIGGVSAINVAGFTWNANQDIIVTQDAVPGNFITVFGIFVDVFPKGV